MTAAGRGVTAAPNLWLVTRMLLLIAAIAFGVLGAAAFAARDWASQNFPWSVGPFVAMSIGGWSLGTAAIALDAQRRTPASAYPLLVFLWLFGLGEAIVLLGFLDRAVFSAALAWPYLIGLLALIASTFTGVPAVWMSDWRAGAGASAPRWVAAGTAVFVLIVLGLSLATLLARPGGSATEGGFVPEKMTLFTVRAFSAFFLAIAGASLAVLAGNRVRTYLDFGRAGLYLIIPITIAALVNLSAFDFAARPGGLVYLGAYVIVGLGVLVFLLLDQRRAGPLAR